MDNVVWNDVGGGGFLLLLLRLSLGKVEQRVTRKRYPRRAAWRELQYGLLRVVLIEELPDALVATEPAC
jgi:hypothetical protein